MPIRSLRAIVVGWLSLSLLLLTGCVTTYADGRTESFFDGFKNPFSSDPDKAWQPTDVQPGNFLRPDTNPILFAPRSENMPELIVLENVPEALDQGQMPAGPIFSAGYIANSMLQASKVSSYRCSPSFLFRMLNGSASTAVELNDTLKFLQTSGCARLTLVPYRNPGDYVQTADALAVRDARNFRIQGFGRVDVSDREQIRNHLALGRVVITELVLPENFVAFSGKVFDDPEGDVLGRQSFALIGYDAKKERVLVQNSMGLAWGDKGRAWIPLFWFSRLVVDAYVIY